MIWTHFLCVHEGSAMAPLCTVCVCVCVCVCVLTGGGSDGVDVIK